MRFTNKRLKNCFSELLLYDRLSFPIEASIRNEVIAKLVLQILIWGFCRQLHYIRTELTAKLAIL